MSGLITSTDVNELINNNVDSLINTNETKEMSLESMTLLVNIEILKNLENKIKKEFSELKERQDRVSVLHKLIKEINSVTTDNQIDCTGNTKLTNLLAKAQEYGVEIQEGKLKFNKEERERLIDNIRLTVDDFNVLNDMQLQTVTRLTTERYESYQLARSIMKPLHEDKINKARAARGG